MSGTGSSSWWPYSCQPDELVRELVDRGGAEPVAGAQALDERRARGSSTPSEWAFGLPR